MVLWHNIIYLRPIIAKMRRNYNVVFGKIFYMLCGVIFCLIFQEIFMYKKKVVLISTNTKGSVPYCNCPEELQNVLLLYQKTLKIKIELENERKYLESILRFIDSNDMAMNDVGQKFLSERTGQLPADSGNIFLNLSRAPNGHTKLTSWSFDHKYIYQATPALFNPKFLIAKNKQKELFQVVGVALNKICNQLAKLRHNSKCELLQGYLNINLKTGLELSFILKKTNQTSVRVSGSFKLAQNFTINDMKTMSNKNNEIHIITMISDAIPLSRLKDFLTMLQKLKIENQWIFVYFSIYANAKNSKLFSKQILNASKIMRNIKIKISYSKEKFERGAGRHHGVFQLPNRNVLILFADIDMTFGDGFLTRCQLYADPGRSVYFPIIFSLYNPKFSQKKGKKKFVISKNRGLWRVSGLGNLCVYKNDYLKIGGFDTKMSGWGSEDDDLYQRLVALSSTEKLSETLDRKFKTIGGISSRY